MEEKSRASIWPPKGFEQYNFRGVPVIAPPDAMPHVTDVLEGRYAHVATKRDTTVRRVLDMGDTWGEFSVWASKRWPNAWIDILVEDLAEMGTWENLPPGTRVRVASAGMPLDLRVYDVVCIRDRKWLPIAMNAWPQQIQIVDVLSWGVN